MEWNEKMDMTKIAKEMSSAIENRNNNGLKNSTVRIYVSNVLEMVLACLTLRLERCTRSERRL